MAVSVFPAPSAGPTLTEITTAITTNTAPASVTNASIASAVLNNSPSPNNWTVVATSAALNYNTSTVTFSGLSGYKQYRVLIPTINISGSSNGFAMRINNDATSGNYSSAGWSLYNSGIQSHQRSGDSSLLFDLQNDNTIQMVDIVINNAHLNSHKIAKSESGTNYQYGNYMTRTHMIMNTSPVNSITFSNYFGTGTFGGGKSIYLLGAN